MLHVLRRELLDCCTPSKDHFPERIHQTPLNQRECCKRKHQIITFLCANWNCILMWEYSMWGDLLVDVRVGVIRQDMVLCPEDFNSFLWILLQLEEKTNMWNYFTHFAGYSLRYTCFAEWQKGLYIQYMISERLILDSSLNKIIIMKSLGCPVKKILYFKQDSLTRLNH